MDDYDPEIAAMGRIAAALASLDQDATRRVLKWAIERYQGSARQSPTHGTMIETPTIVSETTTAPPRTFLDISELFDTADAETGLDRVLVAAYWFQAIQKMEDWYSQSISAELKHLGHPSTNITRDLDALMDRSPKLAMQVRKQGTSRQARKRYKLTREGTRAVESLLARTAFAAR